MRLVVNKKRPPPRLSGTGFGVCRDVGRSVNSGGGFSFLGLGLSVEAEEGHEAAEAGRIYWASSMP